MAVDLADQVRLQYGTCRKAKKWWKYLFWILFDIALCNAFLTMKESANHLIITQSRRTKKRRQLDFRKNLGQQLITGFRGSRKQSAVSAIDSEGNCHWPVKFDKRGKCKQCSQNGSRHEVFIGCEVCKVRLYLDRDCFRQYHKKLPNLQ